jgi:hypothetical protein
MFIIWVVFMLPRATAAAAAADDDDNNNNNNTFSITVV